MGIFSKPKRTYDYVPAINSTSTLLGESAQPGAGQYDDLNRSPTTTVELRFRHFAFPTNETTRDHAFIVVTDNSTGKQWVHQASPGGPAGDPIMGSIIASTIEYKKGERGFDDPYRTVARFTTDAAASSVTNKLNAFSDRFNQNDVNYQLPPDVLPMVPHSMQDIMPTRNSNYYGGLVWQYLTGSIPMLPGDMDAPGWGDHIRDPYGATP